MSLTNNPFGGDKVAHKAMSQRVCNAAKEGQADMLGDLLSMPEGRIVVNDADPMDQFRRTALHYASTGNHVQCVRLLLKNGATVDQVDVIGQSALHWACFDGHDDCAAVLLDAGAKVDICNTYIQTPLMQAKNVACVQLLLERGADVCKVDGFGLSALFYACINRRGTGKLLLQRGAPIDEDWSVFTDGETAMARRDQLVNELGGADALRWAFEEWVSRTRGRHTKSAIKRGAPLPLHGFAHMAAALRALLE